MTLPSSPAETLKGVAPHLFYCGFFFHPSAASFPSPRWHWKEIGENWKETGERYWKASPVVTFLPLPTLLPSGHGAERARWEQKGKGTAFYWVQGCSKKAFLGCQAVCLPPQSPGLYLPPSSSFKGINLSLDTSADNCDLIYYPNPRHRRTASKKGILIFFGPLKAFLGLEKHQTRGPGEDN